MVCAGSDGQATARQIACIALGWRLRQVVEPLTVRSRTQTAEAILAPKTIGEVDIKCCTDLGAAIAVACRRDFLRGDGQAAASSGLWAPARITERIFFPCDNEYFPIESRYRTA